MAKKTQLNWKTARPTMKEYAQALKAAGLPTDPAQWIGAEMVERAAQVLDAAHAAKLEKFIANA